ncbi:MAG: peptidoglycan DD-metalloendopeptidase family protein [Clostridia bacterium]|nr:peptidoglycan DD-metalloendopeptidase family protein [Clostridia bacterium]
MAVLQLPYRGRIRFTSPYGDRLMNGRTSWHNGIDLVGLESKTVIAPCAGRVAVSTMIPRETDLTRTWEWGNIIRIDTGDGMRVYLCHLSERLVNAGETVSAGQPVGIEGDTGYTFGAHLHFEVRRGEAAVNPCPLLGIENRAGVTLEGAPIAAPTWYDEASKWAVDAGILKGTGDGLALDEPCTRAMMVTFLYRFWAYIKNEAITK